MTFIARQNANSAAEHKFKRSLLGVALLTIVSAIGWQMLEQAINSSKPTLESFMGSFGAEVLPEASDLNDSLNPNLVRRVQDGFRDFIDGQPAEAPTPIPTPEAVPVPSPSPNMEPQVLPKSTAPTLQPVDPYASMPPLQITSCGEAVGEGANFRAAPNLSPSSIHGVVPTGAIVYRTGNEWRDESGQEWIEVVYPNWLHPSTTPNAQAVLEPNQIGWINSCFLQGGR